MALVGIVLACVSVCFAVFFFRQNAPHPRKLVFALSNSFGPNPPYLKLALRSLSSSDLRRTALRPHRPGR